MENSASFIKLKLTMNCLLHRNFDVIDFHMEEPINDNRGQIKTRMTRKLRSPQIGEMEVEHTFVDKPASLETWIDHCGKLGEEIGMSTLDVHRALFAVLLKSSAAMCPPNTDVTHCAI